MTNSFSLRFLLSLTLLFGVMSAATAADSFYIPSLNIRPGETRSLSFILDNDTQFFGFQADLSLPDGLEIVSENGKRAISLSSRADASFSLVSNILSDGTLRLGAFSTSHTPISGNSGTLLFVKVKADDNFSGGTLALSDILFFGADDKDVQLPDYSIQLGNSHVNSLYIPDFKFAVGESKTVNLILDNDTEFTAFQTDIVLPKGLSIDNESFKLTDRASSEHSVSYKNFGDSIVRIVCFSLDNTPIDGVSGSILQFDVAADKDAQMSSFIRLNNIICSMTDGNEFGLSDSSTEVTVDKSTGIDDDYFINKDIEVRIQHQHLIVKGVPESTEVILYNINGYKLKSLTSDGVPIHIDLVNIVNPDINDSSIVSNSSSIYILKIGSYTHKFTIK